MKKLITIATLILPLMFLLVPISCSRDTAELDDVSSPVTLFPVQKAGLGQMEALMEGELVLDNGYLRVESIYSEGSYLLIWPYGFSLNTEDEEIKILDEDGKEVARVGDNIKVGGGEEKVGDYCQQLDDCFGPYWIVGDVIDSSSPLSDTEQPEKYAELAEKYKDDPALFDAAMYAEEAGITMDEAVRRLELQPVIGKLDAELSSNEMETFAGLWIEIPPEFKIVVLFTNNGEETIEPYLLNYPDLAELIEVRSAEFTYIELRNAQQEITSSLRSLGIFTESEGDVKGNCVNVYVFDRTLIDDAVRDGKLTVPDCVKIIKIGEMEELEHDD